MHKKKNIAIFVAARSGSKRLKNKHFLKINSELSVIDLCILRLKKTKITKKIFLCTTKKKIDNKFKKICLKHKINLFRGDENNVLKRFIDCADQNSVEIIVRITGDCPLIDPKIIDKCVELHLKKKMDYTTNTINVTFPDGLDVEVVNFNSLKKSLKNSNTKYNKEHVTGFIRSSKLFKKYNYKYYSNYSNRRWTLDYLRDFNYIKRVVKFFYPNIYFGWKDLIKFEKINKTLINIKQR